MSSSYWELLWKRAKRFITRAEREIWVKATMMVRVSTLSKHFN